MKLYRFSSPIQLQPLQENPNSSSEAGSLYYSALDNKVKLRESSSWEDLATIKYVDAQDFGADHVALTNVSGTDLIRWDVDADSWVNEAALQIADGTPNGIIATNSSGLLDKTFLYYDLDRQGNGIYNLPEPVLESEATTRSYVDRQEFGAYNIDIVGLRNNDFMRYNNQTGKWQNVMAVYEAAPESERWDEVISTNPDGFLDKSFLQYNIDMGGHTFYNLLEPVENADCATKNYCDTQALGANNVTITSASNFNMLQYDGGINKWVNVSGIHIATTPSQKTFSILDQVVYTLSSSNSVSSVENLKNGSINITDSYQILVTDSSCGQSFSASGIIQQAAKFSKAAAKNSITDTNLHLVEVYDTNLPILSGQSGQISSFAFPATSYAGCRVEYRLKASTSGNVRVGTLYIGVNGNDASITDFYTETDSLDISWSVNVVSGTVQLEYTNGSGDKLLTMDTKYFP